MASEPQHPFLRPEGRPSISVILEGELLVSSFPTANDAAWLRGEHGVQAVLSLQDDWDLLAKNLVEADLQAAYVAAGIAFTRLPIVDGDLADVARHMNQVLDHMEAAIRESGTLLVHCNAGYNRAPTAAIGYLHRCHGMKLSEAELFVRRRRSCAPYTSILEA
jgi:protein-tyrosine phosphatase